MLLVMFSNSRLGVALRQISPQNSSIYINHSLWHPLDTLKTHIYLCPHSSEWEYRRWKRLLFVWYQYDMNPREHQNILTPHPNAQAARHHWVVLISTSSTGNRKPPCVFLTARCESATVMSPGTHQVSSLDERHPAYVCLLLAFFLSHSLCFGLGICQILSL